MSVEVVVIGAGGFGRECLDVLEAAGSVKFDDAMDSGTVGIAGVADDAPAHPDLSRLTARGIRYLGTTDDVLSAREYRQFIVGIGDPAVKARIAAKFVEAGWKPVTVVHPDASIGSMCKIGQGSVVCGGVQISTNTSLGRYIHLNPNVTVGHDVRLEDFVSVNPGSVVSGEVIVGEQSLLGAGSVILQGLVVGSQVTVGASACVVKNVESGTTMVGVPARPLKNTSSAQLHDSGKEWM